MVVEGGNDGWVAVTLTANQSHPTEREFLCGDIRTLCPN